MCIAETDADMRSLVRGASELMVRGSVVGECADGLDALRLARRHHANVIVADAQLPGVDGFQIARELRKNPAIAVLLTTRDPTDGIRAFLERVVDCVLKPADPARWRLALSRAHEHVDQAEAIALSRRAVEALARLATPPLADERYLTKLSVPMGSRSVIIQSAAIEWVGAEDCYSRVHSDEGSFLIRQTLGTLERRLDPNAFLRPHRSAVVNVDRVRELRRSSDGGTVLVLRSGIEIPVSQRRQQAVRQRVAGIGE